MTRGRLFALGRLPDLAHFSPYTLGTLCGESFSFTGISSNVPLTIAAVRPADPPLLGSLPVPTPSVVFALSPVLSSPPSAATFDFSPSLTTTLFELNALAPARGGATSVAPNGSTGSSLKLHCPGFS